MVEVITIIKVTVVATITVIIKVETIIMVVIIVNNRNNSKIVVIAIIVIAANSKTGCSLASCTSRMLDPQVKSVPKNFPDLGTDSG